MNPLTAVECLVGGDDELLHESDTDEYWGRLPSGAGDNRLGLILMQLRAELRGASTESSRNLPEWVIIHVPHDSTHIPADVLSQFAISAADLQLEVTKMTDHSTLDLFGQGVPQQQIVRAPVSRLVVDVERFEDDRREPMATRGMGVVYERASDGRPLRYPFGPEVRQALIDRWYRPQHDRLAELTCQALTLHGQALLVDAHSFPSKPLPYEPDQRTDRPQICIGTDEFHTPYALAESFVHAFRDAGFDVRLNAPYAGALVPMRNYQDEARVCAVMVEINRALYLDEASGERGATYGTAARTIRQCIDRAISAWAERAALCQSDGATAVPAMSMLPFKNGP